MCEICKMSLGVRLPLPLLSLYLSAGAGDVNSDDSNADYANSLREAGMDTDDANDEEEFAVDDAYGGRILGYEHHPDSADGL